MSKRTGRDREREFRTTLSVKEKEQFLSVAESVQLPPQVILRHLARYFLNDKTDLGNLLNISQKRLMDAENEANYKNETKVEIRSPVPDDLHEKFTGFVKSWGMTSRTMIRRMILLYSHGDIEKCEILP